MTVKQFFRYPNIVEGIEITKKELMELLDKYNYLSIAKVDLSTIKEQKDDEIVGAILGDIEEILNDNTDTLADCWFINKVFLEGHYKSLSHSTFKFGEALELLKKGYKVARKGWSEKGRWLILQPTTENLELRDGSVYKRAGLDEAIIHGHIDMYMGNGTVQPGWVPSHRCLLAEDWIVV